jgi:uncharacterized protein YbjT (DUF2867 family)
VTKDVGNRMILVIGGTGMLGRPVAERLKADGFAVRLPVRDLDKPRRLLGAPPLRLEEWCEKKKVLPGG